MICGTWCPWAAGQTLLLLSKPALLMVLGWLLSIVAVTIVKTLLTGLLSYFTWESERGIVC